MFFEFISSRFGAENLFQLSTFKLVSGRKLDIPIVSTFIFTFKSITIRHDIIYKFIIENS